MTMKFKIRKAVRTCDCSHHAERRANKTFTWHPTYIVGITSIGLKDEGLAVWRFLWWDLVIIYTAKARWLDQYVMHFPIYLPRFLNHLQG